MSTLKPQSTHATYFFNFSTFDFFQVVIFARVQKSAAQLKVSKRTQSVKTKVLTFEGGPLSLCASILMIRTLEIKYTDEKAAINADATDL